MIIYGYEDFVKALLEVGFSLGGGKDEGTISLIPWSWNEEPPYETPVRWHTGDRETDPWEWRIRVLEEREDLAYGKFFFKKSGFISKEWFLYFLRVRRGDESFLEDYERGAFSYLAKRIYDCVEEKGAFPLHRIKEEIQCTKEDKSAFDRALVELQMGLYLTIGGRTQKRSKTGEEYGWSSTVLTTTENFWGEEVFDTAKSLTREEAMEKISRRILEVNSEANAKKIKKFIEG